MKRILPLLFLAATSASAAPVLSNPTLDEQASTPLGSAFDVLDPPVAAVLCPGAAFVWVEWTQDRSTVVIPMTATGDRWSATMPVNHAGVASYRFCALDAAGERAASSTYGYTITENTTDAGGLPDVRRPDFDTRAFWNALSSGTSLNPKSVTVGAWRVGKGYMTAYSYIQLPGCRANSTEGNQSWIRTWGNNNGVDIGTVWFKARVNNTNIAGTLVIEVSDKANAGSPHTVVQTVPIEPGATEGDFGQWQQYRVNLQDVGKSTATPTPYWIRFRNATVAPDGEPLGNYQIHISDIVVGPKLPDVKIVRSARDYEPGYPSVQDPITFRVSIADVYSDAPSANATPWLVWRQEGGAWNTTLMTNVLGRSVTGPGDYACTLTDHSWGSFEYFYEVGFTGYAPTFPADHWGREPANADAFRIYPDAAGTITESRAPAYWPDFRDTADGAVLPSGERRDPEPLYDAYAYDKNDRDGKREFEWDLSHLFDLRNLDDGWPRAVNDPSVEVEAPYSYGTLLAPEGVRHFRSLYGNLTVAPTNALANRLEEAYEMMQVGDYTWQAIIHLTNALDTAFSVTGAYQYVEGFADYEPGPFEWGEVNQEPTAINPPMAGFITCTNDAALPVRTVIDYDGFLMFRFCTTNGEYQIRRAAWQDFNTWQADNNYYTRSFGLYGTKTFRSDLEGRDLTTFEPALFSPLEGEVDPEEEMSASAYWAGMLGNNAWVVRERERRYPNDKLSDTANLAYRLSTRPELEGSLQTTKITASDGRDQLTFKVRAASDDDRIAFYKDGASWQNYWVSARVSVASMSDGNPSVSLIGYYQDERNYWEARFTQVSELVKDNNNPYRNGIRVQLFKVANGVSTEVYGTFTSTVNDKGDTNTGVNTIARMPRGNNNANAKSVKTGNYLLSGGWTFALSLQTSGTSVTPTIEIYKNATLDGKKQGDEVTPEFKYTFSAVAGGPTGGAPGFNARDCDATFTPYVFDGGEKVRPSDKSSADAYSAVTTAVQSSWNLGVREVYGYVSPWTFNSGNPASLRRPVPTVYWRLETYRSGVESSPDFLAPVPGEAMGSSPSDWSTEWDQFHSGADGIKTVTSYDWTTVSVPLHFWDDTFLKIQALSQNGSLASSGMLMVDDLAVDSWRGQLIHDPDYPDERTNTLSWVGTYAVIAEDGRTGRRYELSRSRANPNPDPAVTGQERQSVSTPLLVDGVGDVLFNYRAEDEDVEFVIESVIDGEATELARYVAVAGAPSATAYGFAGQREVSGRLRVRTIDNGSVGTLYVDNFRATDFPNSGSSSWEVYNALVSTFASNPSLKFDGTSAAAATYRSLVLNDAPDKDTERGKSWDDNAPYVQTPSIETGVGEVSFWYRAHPSNNGQPAKLVLAVANSPSAPDEQWVPLTEADLNDDPVQNPRLAEEIACLDAIEAIVDDQWRYFSAEFFKQDYRLLRFYSMTEDGRLNRIMLDNVLVTEPVRASIDVGQIEFDPGIPLCTKDTTVKVRLVNPRMNPHDIEVYLDWYASDEAPERREVVSSYDVVSTNWITTTTIEEDGTEVTRRKRNIGTTTYATTNETRLPPSLPWGREAWDSFKSGTLTFTNTLESPYAFASVETIPTSAYPPDTVFQYCAHVEYQGKFSEAIYSETQGRTRNGFWFDNPKWYEPIDLNEEFGTTNQPVAHFWNFTVPTNCVFINEFLPADNNVAHDALQFVEIMGPEGGEITDWTLWHQTVVSGGTMTWGDFFHTNVLASAETGRAIFAPPTNAKEDKGWGFYLLGAAHVSPRDQELFPNAGKDDYMYIPGALMLKRSMGAYADRVVWGETETTTRWRDSGYTYVGTRRKDAHASFVLKGDTVGEAGGLTWSTTAAFTRGGYNDAEEENLWHVDQMEPVEDESAEISRPVITAYELLEDRVRITFEVATVNGVDLKADSFTWFLDSAADAAFESTDNGRVIGQDVTLVSPASIAAPAGETLAVTVEAPLNAAADVRFYRIRAWRMD